MPTKKNKFINEFNEFTNDEGIDNMIKHDKINYQKSQTEVKDSANVAITENCIRFVNTKTVPNKRFENQTPKLELLDLPIEKIAMLVWVKIWTCSILIR